MTYVTCRLAAKNRDQLRNPTLSNRVWAIYLYLFIVQVVDRTAGGGRVGSWWNCELNVEAGNSSSLETRDGWEYYDVDVSRCH